MPAREVLSAHGGRPFADSGWASRGSGLRISAGDLEHVCEKLQMKRRPSGLEYLSSGSDTTVPHTQFQILLTGISKLRRDSVWVYRLHVA